VLVGDVRLRARELLREIARNLEMRIYAGAIHTDMIMWGGATDASTVTNAGARYRP